MDDREWIERLRSTPPHQMEAGELRRVKRTIAESPEFCEALAADPSLQRLVDAAFAVRDETHVESPPESAPGRLPLQCLNVIFSRS